jgi:hypothetical protein
VRKGEATSVVFWKQMHRHQHADAGPSDADSTHCDEHGDQPRFFARGYYLFNTRQVGGYAPPDLPSLPMRREFFLPGLLYPEYARTVESLRGKLGIAVSRQIV